MSHRHRKRSCRHAVDRQTFQRTTGENLGHPCAGEIRLSTADAVIAGSEARLEVRQAARKNGMRAALMRSVNSIIGISYFPLLTAVASFFGAVFPAMLAHKIVSSHANPRVVWTPLVNASMVGACLGVLCGAFCTAAYKALHPACDLRVCADRAFEFTQITLFWIGLAIGISIGVLTISTFRSTLIYAWPTFSKASFGR